ncbi:DUF4019 domain-containing protein [Thermodesulfobacteriota bacterium]
MKRNAFHAALFVLFWLLTLSQAAAADDAAANDAIKDAAQKASGAWLNLVDKGEYTESWKEAAAYFKGAVSEKQWKESLDGHRKPLGKVLSRTVKIRTYSKTLPGAPDGEYVVILYDTSFENKASAIETVTPMLDKDGKWRVAGYYIK